MLGRLLRSLDVPHIPSSLDERAEAADRLAEAGKARARITMPDPSLGHGELLV